MVDHKLKQMKVVLNACYGGFGLSFEALRQIVARKWQGDPKLFAEFFGLGMMALRQQPDDCELRKLVSGVRDGSVRHDPDLVAVVAELGEAAGGQFSRLVIEEIPDEYAPAYRITEYDGMEEVELDDLMLIRLRLKEHDLTTISDSECRQLLKTIVEIADR